MGSEILLVVVVAVVVILRFLAEQQKGQIQYPYKLCDSLLTPTEMQFYVILREATDATICVKPRMADILKAPRDDRASFARISQKHTDFILCDPATMRPILAVELDDKSHERADRRARDEFVDKAMQAAKLPILHVKVRQRYDLAELRASINTSLSPSRPLS